MIGKFSAVFAKLCLNNPSCRSQDVTIIPIEQPCEVNLQDLGKDFQLIVGNKSGSDFNTADAVPLHRHTCHL